LKAIFGEQYTEDVTDWLGLHKVLRYRVVSRNVADPAGGGANPTYWKPSE